MSAVNPDPSAAPLDAVVAALWPAMADRLGSRRAAFIDTARQQAQTHGLDDEAHAARYLNLCFAFGPAFENKPENEWALAVLADERLAPWTKLHQLVVRALRELARRGGDAPALLAADSALLDTLQARQLASRVEVLPLARKACDLEAVDLRLQDIGWRREYRRADGSWQHLAMLGEPPPLRIAADHPAPSQVCVLTRAKGGGPPARLQIRLLAHAGCDGDRHPGVRWIGSHGLNAWFGHEARALSWPVYAMAQRPNASGLGLTLVEQTTPEIGIVEILACGLRDDGVPLGPQHLQVWSYPAHQWLFGLQRPAPAELTWPQASPPSTNATRVRIERDGAARIAGAWVHGFDVDLARATAAGFDKLYTAWQQTAQQATMRVTPGLLGGRAALTWGWREGPDGMAGLPLLRLLGELDLSSSVELTMMGEVDAFGTRTRVRLSARGQARLQCDLTRESPAPDLLATLMPAVLKWRMPFEIDFDPVANDDGSLWCEAGPCSGALVGEAGLRPVQDGGSGWQWFVRLAVEPVLSPITVHDPVLGQTRRTLALLPAAQLVDWSLG